MTAPSFDFATAHRVVFGPGRATELPSLIDGWGSRALVFTGTRPERHQQLLGALPQRLLPRRQRLQRLECRRR